MSSHFTASTSTTTEEKFVEEAVRTMKFLVTMKAVIDEAAIDEAAASIAKKVAATEEAGAVKACADAIVATDEAAIDEVDDTEEAYAAARKAYADAFWDCVYPDCDIEDIWWHSKDGDIMKTLNECVGMTALVDGHAIGRTKIKDGFNIKAFWANAQAACDIAFMKAAAAKKIVVAKEAIHKTVAMNAAIALKSVKKATAMDDPFDAYITAHWIAKKTHDAAVMKDIYKAAVTKEGVALKEAEAAATAMEVATKEAAIKEAIHKAAHEATEEITAAMTTVKESIEAKEAVAVMETLVAKAVAKETAFAKEAAVAKNVALEANIFHTSVYWPAKVATKVTDEALVAAGAAKEAGNTMTAAKAAAKEAAVAKRATAAMEALEKALDKEAAAAKACILAIKTHLVVQKKADAAMKAAIPFKYLTEDESDLIHYLDRFCGPV